MGRGVTGISRGGDMVKKGGAEGMSFGGWQPGAMNSGSRKQLL